MFISWMLVMPSFQKSLVVEQFQGNYLNNSGIDLFSLYVLFSHFRPRDVPKGIFFLFLHKLYIHMHVQKTTFERNCSLE